MATRKSTAPAPVVKLENITVTNNTAANEHTRAAIEALADAARANAQAIEAAAKALNPYGCSQTGIRVGSLS